ncbi:hypothetical protein HML84_02135 [Alcanivorax sp. IO_7]|nr:hypothetical protein HML84_02135 [Alcanivorax sp. IO_7]
MAAFETVYVLIIGFSILRLPPTRTLFWCLGSLVLALTLALVLGWSVDPAALLLFYGFPWWCARSTATCSTPAPATATPTPCCSTGSPTACGNGATTPTGKRAARRCSTTSWRTSPATPGWRCCWTRPWRS